MERKTSYTGEFDLALEREILGVEKFGNRVLTVILFGSLAYQMPRLGEDGIILRSDADILVIVDDDKRRGDFTNRKIEFSDREMLHGKKIERFSENIPHAEIHVQSISAVKDGLEYLIKQCQRARDFDYVPLKFTDTAILQALTSGIVLKGTIPEEICPEIEKAKDAVLSCNNRSDEPGPLFLF